MPLQFKFSYNCLLVACFILFSGRLTHAQTDTAASDHHFSLQDCISYAMEHEHDVANARLDKQYSHEVVGENIGNLFPHVNLSGSFVDNLKLATTLIPDFSSGNLQNKIPVQFGNKYTSSISGQADQTIFNSNYFLGLKAAKVFEELSVKQLVSTEVNTRVNVTKAYFNVLVNQEGLRISKSNLEQLHKSLRDIQAKYQVGMVGTIDVNRIEVQYNDAKTGIGNQQRLLTYSLTELKFQMGMPQEDELNLSQSVEEFSPQLVNADTSNYELTDRPEYEMQKIQIDLNKLNLKSTKLSFLPSLSAYVNYGFSYFSSTFPDLYRKGFDNSALGLTLSFPIFSGTERIHQTNQAKISLEQSLNDIAHLRQQIKVEVKNAYMQYLNNRDQLQTQQKNMELTQGVYDRVNYQFKQGVASSLDLFSAENELQRSQSKYIDALLNVLVSGVDLERAMGKLMSNQ